MIVAGTAWKVSKFGVFSGPYFPVFGLNAGKYGAEKTPFLDTFDTVREKTHSNKPPTLTKSMNIDIWVVG